MKQRETNSVAEREGILAVSQACLHLNLIWRDLYQEDVGVDGTIEIVTDNFPTGKIVGAQVKSGKSYIKSETANTFRFYPNPDDVDYWRRLTLPLFLFVYDATAKQIYWLDVQSYTENRPLNPIGNPVFEFDKANRLDETFRGRLEQMFDLTTYDNDKYREVREELEGIVYRDDLEDSVTISALQIFLKGLWGLCTKVQFHFSLFTDEIRSQLSERDQPSFVRYNLSRAKVFPFVTGYFNVLTRHHLAILDVADLNHTLYGKLEWPAYIAPLTVNGRRFVQYLRTQLAGQRPVSDQQFLSFTLFPHVQIERYENVDLNTEPITLGRCIDVIAIQFNPYLDYYHLWHFTRLPAERRRVLAETTMFYYEMIDYLKHQFKDTPKDNFICRYQDGPISPLICWLEDYLEYVHPLPPAMFAEQRLSDHVALIGEFINTISPAGEVTHTDANLPDFPVLSLANGEPLFERPGS